MDRLLKAEEVARITGMARSTLYKLAAKGEVPCVRYSARVVRFPLGALEEWLRKKTVAAPRK